MSRRNLLWVTLCGLFATIGVSCDRSSSQPEPVPEQTDQRRGGLALEVHEEPASPKSNKSGIEAERPHGKIPKKPKRADIYDTRADAKAQIETALAKAKRDNKRVLLQFGGNWCSWCYKLHDVFNKNHEIASLLRNEYELVLVDIGQMDKNMELAESYGAELKKHGVPFLTVLEDGGQVVTNQNTGDLEDGPVHDIDKVKAFLQKWTPEPLDAEVVLTNALARAEAEKKRLLVHLGAPW